MRQQINVLTCSVFTRCTITDWMVGSRKALIGIIFFWFLNRRWVWMKTITQNGMGVDKIFILGESLTFQKSQKAKSVLVMWWVWLSGSKLRTRSNRQKFKSSFNRLDLSWFESGNYLLPTVIRLYVLVLIAFCCQSLGQFFFGSFTTWQKLVYFW